MSGQAMEQKETLYWSAGHVQGTLADLLEPWRTEPPLLTWVEPAVGVPNGEDPGPVAAVLQRGLPSDTLALDEARLFWPDRCVHLLAEPGGWSWFAFGDRPLDGWMERPVTTQRQALVTLRNWHPFKVRDNPVLTNVQNISVMLYLDPDLGHCLQWRILPWLEPESESRQKQEDTSHA